MYNVNILTGDCIKYIHKLNLPTVLLTLLLHSRIKILCPLMVIATAIVKNILIIFTHVDVP